MSFSGMKVRHRRGFTLVEVLTTCIIIGILAAIFLPNFIGAKKNALTAEVRGNMHTWQTASEAFATDTGGRYGLAAEVLPYFPGGSMSVGGTAGNLPFNPCTKVANEMPITGGPVTSAQINTLRSQLPSAFGTMGRVSYDQVDGTDSYAVVGCDANNPSSQVSGAGGRVMVLSNQ